MNADEVLAWHSNLFEAQLQPFAAAPAEAVVGIEHLECRLGYTDATPHSPGGLAATLEFQQVDTGLYTTDGQELAVRCELFTRAEADVPREHLMAVLGAATNLMHGAAQTIPAQPGTLLPVLAKVAQLPEEDYTVTHAVLVPPSLWEQGIPQIVEAERIVLMLELLMLTQDEYEYALTYGANALLEAMQQGGYNPLDWRRRTNR